MFLGTFAFDCPNCGQFLVRLCESDRSVSDCPACGASSPRGFVVCGNLSVPPHMQAVSGDVQARQAAYLSSDREKADREKDERIQERQHEFDNRKETELPKIVDKALDEHYSDPRTREPGYNERVAESRRKEAAGEKDELAGARGAN